jgi:hypothetical protein
MTRRSRQGSKLGFLNGTAEHVVSVLYLFVAAFFLLTIIEYRSSMVERIEKAIFNCSASHVIK